MGHRWGRCLTAPRQSGRRISTNVRSCATASVFFPVRLLGSFGADVELAGRRDAHQPGGQEHATSAGATCGIGPDQPVDGPSGDGTIREELVASPAPGTCQSRERLPFCHHGRSSQGVGRGRLSFRRLCSPSLSLLSPVGRLRCRWCPAPKPGNAPRLPTAHPKRWLACGSTGLRRWGPTPPCGCFVTCQLWPFPAHPLDLSPAGGWCERMRAFSPRGRGCPSLSHAGPTPRNKRPAHAGWELPGHPSWNHPRPAQVTPRLSPNAPPASWPCVGWCSCCGDTS